VALQRTTREVWAAEGGFIPYEIENQQPRQDVPESFIKGASWRVVNAIERYHAQSSAPEYSSGEEHWYPVEFNTERACWTEIRWIENLEVGGHWEAFRIAGPDLGLDITLQDAADQDRIDHARRIHSQSPDRTPTTRTSTPSVVSEASNIQVRSPAPQRGSNQIIALQLAESLHIQEPIMSRTMTMEPAAGTINPHTGHMEMPMHPDEVALHRAIGPDQADPPSDRDVTIHQEYHSDGRVVDHQDKAQEEDHSAEDPQEEEDHRVAEDPQKDSHSLCHKRHNQEDSMATN
jgi:hypothetical protein